jgi:hypothetical protein
LSKIISSWAKRLHSQTRDVSNGVSFNKVENLTLIISVYNLFLKILFTIEIHLNRHFWFEIIINLILSKNSNEINILLVLFPSISIFSYPSVNKKPTNYPYLFIKLITNSEFYVIKMLVSFESSNTQKNWYFTHFLLIAKALYRINFRNSKMFAIIVFLSQKKREIKIINPSPPLLPGPTKTQTF